MRTLLIVLAALALQACTSIVEAGSLLDLEVIDRASGRVLETHPYHGKRYIAGNPGERYGLRLSNRSSGRILAVVSVDGINAVTGETASPAQPGYVLEPYANAEISGWRKNMDEVAQFYFTALPDSYAARTDRPDNVGVIGVAVFRERDQPRIQPSLEAPAARAAPAPSAAAQEMQDSAPLPESRTKRKAERLGTGHGEREYAPTEYTEFRRASTAPSEVVSLHYDSRARLVAMGVIPKSSPWYQPQPFPARFVPDPWR